MLSLDQGDAAGCSQAAESMALGHLPRSGRPLRKALPLASGFWTRAALTRGGARRRLPHCLGPRRVALGALMSPAGVPRASLSIRGLESGVDGKPGVMSLGSTRTTLPLPPVVRSRGEPGTRTHTALTRQDHYAGGDTACGP